ncbi:hypothetical protein ILYODFUR_034246 [Ilyodon furcidens]|uniref:Secreted protein n=1 Tax=Ilyodon furcidens TaxID=33524 RepID=A0ABV0U1E3_9TELE
MILGCLSASSLSAALATEIAFTCSFSVCSQSDLTRFTCTSGFKSRTPTDRQCQIFKSLCVSSVQRSFLVCLPDLISFLPHRFSCSALPTSDTSLASVFWTQPCVCLLTNPPCLPWTKIQASPSDPAALVCSHGSDPVSVPRPPQPAQSPSSQT